jgi:hypothetical protein
MLRLVSSVVGALVSSAQLSRCLVPGWCPQIGVVQSLCLPSHSCPRPARFLGNYGIVRHAVRHGARREPCLAMSPRLRSSSRQRTVGSPGWQWSEYAPDTVRSFRATRTHAPPVYATRSRIRCNRVFDRAAFQIVTFGRSSLRD